jgi:hypothetical protein
MVPSADFDFQPKNNNNRCIDKLSITNLIPLASDQPADDDDSAGSDTAIVYCGMIQGNKVYNFNQSFVTIRLTADDMISGNGAKVTMCFP